MEKYAIPAVLFFWEQKGLGWDATAMRQVEKFASGGNSPQVTRGSKKI